jgi:hypothetical protein
MLLRIFVQVMYGYFCAKHSSVGICPVFCDMKLYRLLFRAQYFKKNTASIFRVVQVLMGYPEDDGFLKTSVPIHQSACLSCPSRWKSSSALLYVIMSFLCTVYFRKFVVLGYVLVVYDQKVRE